MGTTFNVTVIDPDASYATAELQMQIEGLLAAIDARMSTYRPDSELSQLNSSNTTDWIPVSRELCDVVASALIVSDLSNGAFDITVGPLVNLWGFGPDGIVNTPPSDADVDALRASVGYQNLQTDCAAPAIRKDKPGIYVDLSAYAKGYAVDQTASLLDARNVANYLVEIGGELRSRGLNARGEDWAIGIEKPDYGGRSVQSVFELSDIAVATSGDYRNFFESSGKVYSHTIDPRTGYPVEHNGASVTVVAESAAFADAMATALLVLGPDAGIELAQREGIAAFFQLREEGAIVEFTTERFNTELARR